MTKGLFSRLVAGDLPQDGKRWPSDHGNGRVYVIATCTGAFSTTSKPLDQIGEPAADTIEQGKDKPYGVMKAENLARAEAIVYGGDPNWDL